MEHGEGSERNAHVWKHVAYTSWPQDALLSGTHAYSYGGLSVC